MNAKLPAHYSKSKKARGLVNMNHGAGGQASAKLIKEVFLTYFDNPLIHQGNDGAVFSVPPGRLVMSTDAHVISPLFFPGGNIGSLAVHGTVNDLAVMGAKPLYLTASFILEEGFPINDLDKIAFSMAETAKKAGVEIIAGDTKVVEKGKGDGVFITTTGLGIRELDCHIEGNKAEVGDAIIVSGTIGDHGIAIMSHRENLQFETSIESDSAALNGLIEKILESHAVIHCMRDPTRGGLATTLNELAMQSQVSMEILESIIPVKPAVQAACELLGLDPLYIANEGKLVLICPDSDAQKVLEVMRQHPLGKNAEIIGQVTERSSAPLLKMQTQFGGVRVVDWLTGEQLPRIC